MPFFMAPTVRRPVGFDRFWSRFHYNEGMTLYKVDGTYQTDQGLVQDETLQTADEVYLGGHIYAVTDTVAQALANAGYGAGLFDVSDPPPPVGTGAYGDGAYGAGPYGGGDGTPFGTGPYGAGPYG